MTTEELKQQAHKEFDEKFPIQTTIVNWKGIKSFLDSIIDKAVQMTEERIVGAIKERINEIDKKIEPLQNEYDQSYKYWLKLKSEKNRKICEEYDNGAKGNKLFALSEKKEELENLIPLITNKSNINN